MGYCSGELDGAKRSVFKLELILEMERMHKSIDQ
jgi:hypothetical protein